MPFRVDVPPRPRRSTPDHDVRCRVLVLVTRNQRRGPESFAVVLANGLASRQMDVRLHSLAPAPSGVPHLDMAPLGRFPLSPTTLLRLRAQITRSDVVVACGSTTLPASVIAGTGVGRPIIYQNIGDPLFWAGTHGRRFRVRRMLRRVAAVAALSDGSARTLVRHFGVPQSRVRVIPNARSSAVYRPATEREKAAARADLGIPEGQPTVVMIAALSSEKRVDVAIEAVARVRKDVRLLVAGEGPQLRQLERHARDLAPGRVTFLGSRGDIPHLLAAADAVLLTSSSEGLPGVLIEAGLSGLPVVSTDVGYVRDIVIDGETGLLVPPGDVDGLALAVEAALADRERLGAAARAHCTARFDLAEVTAAWSELIEDVLALRGAGHGEPTH